MENTGDKEFELVANRKKPIVTEINRGDIFNFIKSIEKDIREEKADNRIRMLYSNSDIIILGYSEDSPIYINGHIFGTYWDYNIKVEVQLETVKEKAREMYNIINNTDECINVSMWKVDNKLKFNYISMDNLSLSSSDTFPIPEFKTKSKQAHYYRDEVKEEAKSRFFNNLTNKENNLKLQLKTLEEITRLNTAQCMLDNDHDNEVNRLTDLRKCFNDLWRNVSDFYMYADKGHDYKHVFNVFKNGLEMITFFYQNDTPELLFNKYLKMGLACLVHDIFSTISRSNHEEMARDYLLDLSKIKNDKLNEHKNIRNDWMDFYTKEMIIEASQMVFEHRASYQLPFSSMECEIMSAADRGELNIVDIVNRIYTCATDTTCTFNVDIKGFEKHIAFVDNAMYDSDMIINDLLETYKWSNQQVKTFYHLWEKYSRQGYAFSKLDKEGVYFTYNYNNLNSFWKAVDIIIANPNVMLELIKGKYNITVSI